MPSSYFWRLRGRREAAHGSFPAHSRNRQTVSKLHIKSIVFHYRGEIVNRYGDEYYVNVEFAADTSGRIVKQTFDKNEAFIEESIAEIGVKAARKFFNVMVHNYDISFWDADLCCDGSCGVDIDFLDDDDDDWDDDEFDDDDFNGTELDDENHVNNESEQLADSNNGEIDDRIPDWSVETQYKNGTEQITKDYDFIPYSVMELFDDFDDYFEDDEDNEDEDGDNCDDDEKVRGGANP